MNVGQLHFQPNLSFFFSYHKLYFLLSAGVDFVKCLPSYILENYSTRNYRPEALDVGYDKILVDGMGELMDR